MLINPSHPTRAEIAESFTLWGVFVDTLGVDTRERFDAMTEADRLAVMDACFGPEDDDTTWIRNDDERADAGERAYNAAMERGGEQRDWDAAAEAAYDECALRQRQAAEQAYQDNHR